MNIGIVKWFSLEKGYGFIHPDDGRPNIFVHISAVESAGMSGLKEGQRLIFEIEQDERTGRTSAVSLQAPVFAPTPRLEDPFAPRIRSTPFPPSSHLHSRRACGRIERG